MAQDTVNVQRGVLNAGTDFDTYVISPNLVDAGADITITDLGSNRVQLIGGLEIASSLVANDSLRLTLSNGAQITVLSANNFEFELGGNPLTGQAGDVKTFADFATDDLGTAPPAAGDAPVAGANTDVTIGGGNGGGDPTPGDSFELTSGSDAATANVFNADMVFTPDGSDRILSLQDEDELTGIAGRDDNTLNAEIGNRNADEGTTAVVTPELNNIQIVNLDWTGNTTNLDLRFADDIQTVNINKITQDANNVFVDNITTPAANLRVADASNDTTTVTYRYQRGVLTGDETANVELDGVLAAAVTQTALGAGAGREGFETVNLNAVNGNELNFFSMTEMEDLTITGSGFLDIVNLVSASGAVATEFLALVGPSGIGNPGAFGLVTVDASAFTGDLTVDISNAIGPFNDPSNSGQNVDSNVLGGTGDDTLWSSVSAGAVRTGSDVARANVDGGDGNDTYKTTANVTDNATGDVASFTSIEALELRQQGGAQVVDFDAFDSALSSVLMRGEAAGAPVFTLNDLGSSLAEDGLVLRHGITGSTAPLVNARLKDATGTDDTIALTVENDLNTGTTFNYILDFDGDNGDGDADRTDAAVENVTINDADTESNIVGLVKSGEHTGTVTLTGGVSGQTYTVTSSLVAGTVDASAQMSDLRLTVGNAAGTNITQDILLGSGDDILTFMNIDDFSAGDSLTDAGGNDTVRAAFSQDSNLELTGIENLHIIANDNVQLGMAQADVDGLTILADIAADGDGDNSPQTAEPFNIGGVATTDIITLTDTNLTALNFSADLDNDDVSNPADLVNDDDSTVATFNGVTLANNSANALTVNINSALDTVDVGATAYNLGQLTAHGITSMDIQVADEDVETVITGATAVTTINNIFARNMDSLSVSAQGDVNLNTVSGAPLNNSLLTFDASAVGGDLMANVISLGNSATVSLANGDNVFSALGSAGRNISITAGNGDNMITGSAQDDEVTTGSGWDVIAGDRGDNVITSGAGDDTITAKDGNDTFDVGSGNNTVTDNMGTGINASLATNTVSLTGGVTTVAIDVDGNGAIGAGEIDQVLAVGSGSNLTISWTGSTLLDASAVLDGRLAIVEDAAGAATLNGDANANLNLIAGTGVTLQSTSAAGTSTGVKTVNGAGGNDVAMWSGSAAGDGLIFAGGAGSDAAVGTVDNDTFTGGAGKDFLVMQDTAAVDGQVDTISIADGDSTASGWDVVSGFDASVASAAGVVAGSSTAGGDVIDLATATVAAAAANVNGNDVGGIEAHNIAANGLITFDTNDAGGFVATQAGNGSGQLSIDSVLAYLTNNLNATGGTVAFNFDSDGDGALTAADSTFLFQDGAADTVVELIGTFNGVEAVGTGTANVIEIA